MQIVASHRERRREDGSLSIDAVLILGEVEYVLERNCASRRHAQGIADEELRLIRRLILARLRQLHTDKQPASRPMQTGERSDQRKQPDILDKIEEYARTGKISPTLPISPVPSGTKKNGKLPHFRPNTISTADL